jgi:hypothetical protein
MLKPTLSILALLALLLLPAAAATPAPAVPDSPALAAILGAPACGAPATLAPQGAPEPVPATFFCGICSEYECQGKALTSPCHDIYGDLGNCGVEGVPPPPQCSDHRATCICFVN